MLVSTNTALMRRVATEALAGRQPAPEAPEPFEKLFGARLAPVALDEFERRGAEADQMPEATHALRE